MYLVISENNSGYIKVSSFADLDAAINYAKNVQHAHIVKEVELQEKE